MDRLRARVNDRLLSVTQSTDPVMDEMASHLLRAGGKRLRPLIGAVSSLAGEAGEHDPSAGDAFLDQVTDDAITGGVAVELVHVGSLHHDDVIDEAVTRHNVDSVNARWGNLRAILSGDFLLARASELAASLGTEVAALLAATIGRLCEGEVHELRFAYQPDRTEDDYFVAIGGKTAALYATAARIGGLVSGLPPHQTDALEEFGQLYGLAFQVVDDVLDIVATDEQLGKPAGHDMVEGIYTLPVLRCLQHDRDPAASELRTILGAPLDDDARRRALEIVRASGGVTAAVKEASALCDRSVAALDPLPRGPARQLLTDAARSLPPEDLG